MEEAVVTPAAARLCLLAALEWCRQNGTPSTWGDRDWLNFVRYLEPREVVILALHGIRGMEQGRVSEWFGLEGAWDGPRQRRFDLEQAPGEAPRVRQARLHAAQGGRLRRGTWP